jgi:hypothetical protein
MNINSIRLLIFNWRLMFRLTNKTEKLTFVKVMLITLGSISLFLGVLGLFLPVLPTTPFLLLTAYLYAKSSKRMYFWLISNKYFGKYIQRYRDGLGIPLKTKIISLSTMWTSMLITIFYFIPLLFVKILLFLVACAVTYHILSKPTFRE